MLDRLRDYHAALPETVSVLLLLLMAMLVYWVGNRVLVSLAHSYAKHTQHTWDDALIEHKVASRLAQL